VLRFERLGIGLIAGKLRRRLWSTGRAIALVRDLPDSSREDSAADLRVELVPPERFDTLAEIVDAATGVEYLFVRSLERTRQAQAGTIAVARSESGQLLAFHFVHESGDRDALERVAPGMYQQLPDDEVLTEGVYCLPERRGGTVAAKMLKATGSLLAAAGKRRAWAYPDTKNLSSLRMFKRAGYVPAGDERVDRYRLGTYRSTFKSLTAQARDDWHAATADSSD
jgi:L-amino acid N-acyltransferase YncA